MSTSLTERKSFEISKREVWQAYERVRANKGAPGVDRVTIEEFEADLRGNLYKEAYSERRFQHFSGLLGVSD